MSAARYPTTYDVKYVCGHTVTRDLREVDGPKRANRAAWEAKGLCYDCWVDAGKPARPTEARRSDAPVPVDSPAVHPSHGLVEPSTPGPGTPAPGANEWFQRRKLPPLVGTPRQVESAIRIRSQMLAGAWAILDADGWEENEYVIGVETAAKQVLSAKWWIENKAIAAHELSAALEAAARSEKGAG